MRDDPRYDQTRDAARDQGGYGRNQPFDPRRNDEPRRHPLDRDHDGRLDRDDLHGRSPEPRRVEPPRHAEDNHFDRPRDEPRDGMDDEAQRGGGHFEYGSADRRYSLQDTRRELPREETDRLIASNKVEGTAVYDLRGRRIGEIANFMVEKRSGRVEYAVVRMRAGLIAGETYRPIEWRDLRYHERLDGYQIDADRQDLRRDRSFADGR